MTYFRFLSAFFAISLFAGSGWAMDSVKLANGSAVSGKVLKVGWDKVEMEQGVGDNKNFKEVPTKDIVTIFFDSGTPAVKKALTSARTDIAVDKKYAEGLKYLAKIKPAELEDEELRQDYDFYTALANAKLAFAGSGKIQEAGKAMLEFVEKNPNSYHFLEACETVGDLLVAVKNYQTAEKYYGKLARAPWPEVKIKAGVLVGRVQLAQNKLDEAEKSFQSALDLSEGQQADSLRLTAKLGKATVLVARKKGKEAIEMLGGIVEKGDSEDAELMSRTYNALGAAYLQLGDLNEAKMAFLHTDQLYSAVPEAHAEALANLAEIWEKINQPDRAVEARKTLDRLYRNSPWAKQWE
jgi:tetratricopeptide (TPR) repeat protein